MSDAGRDIHSIVDGASRGTALTATRSSARTVDVFAKEIEKNSLVTIYALFAVITPALLPFLFANYDGSATSVRLHTFSSLTQFGIALPFLAFLIAITLTWFFAYYNHIQRVAAVSRYSPIRNYTIASLACGATSITTLLTVEAGKFHFYWSTSLFLILLGYVCALMVVHHFKQLIDEVGALSQGKLIEEWEFWGLLKKYPLGSVYRELSNDQRVLVYDRRVRELQSLNSIVSGWRVSNMTLAFFIAIYAVLTLLSGSTFDLDRNYIVPTTRVLEDGSMQTFANLGNPLAYSIEVLTLFALVVMGILTASLRSIINTTIYSDEVFLLNQTSPLDILNSQKRNLIIEPKSPGSELSSAEGNPVDGSLSELRGVFESARLLPALASGSLLYVSSNELIYAISFTLFLMLSFLFNDLIDFLTGKDVVCHPNRPLPSGRLSVFASVAAIGLCSIALFLTMREFTSFQASSLLIATVISFVYSFAAKRLFPAFGTALWVGAVAISFLGAFGQFQPAFVYVLFCLTFYAREFLLDLRDLEADSEFAKGATIGKLGNHRLLDTFAGLFFVIVAGIYTVFVPNAFWFAFGLAAVGGIVAFSRTGKQKKFSRVASLFAYTGVIFLAG